MVKVREQYKCSACGEVYTKWYGQCPKQTCKQWNTITSYDPPISILQGSAGGVRASKVATGNSPRPVSQIGKETKTQTRLKTNINEFDRVLGGGLVPGGVILLAGAPGIGKSSCALAVASSIAEQGKKVLYITGEETAEQVAGRAIRIGATDGDGNLGENLYLLAEGNLQNAMQELVDLQPDFFIVDSIQTLLSNDSESRLGSITQVNEVATEFTNLAKRMGIPAILIGHITKSGDIGGSMMISHLVDVVLRFEADSDSPLRLLRAEKSRFGSTTELGLFIHTSEGLVPVEDPSGMFTSKHATGTTGYAVSITLEGIRALPVEITALVAKTRLPNPRKITSGIEHGRALQMQAVLDRYIGLSLDTQDVYVATTGGLRLKDTSTDLAVIAAIVSSAQDISLPDGAIFIGEVSLTGEVRPSRERDKRCREAERLGFTTIYTTPSGDKPYKSTGQAKIIEVSTVLELCRLLKDFKK